MIRNERMHSSLTPLSPALTGIDGHAHVFLQDLPMAPGRRYAPAYDASLERYRTMLSDNGMSHGVLVQPSFLGNDNRFLLDCLEQYPTQLRGIVMADPVLDFDALPVWHEGGVVGVRANLIGVPTPDFAAPEWQHFLRAMAALDWHLEVQIDAARLADIATPILASGVRLVVDHFGRFDPLLGIADPGFDALCSLASTRRVWVKISAAYRVAPRGASPEQMTTLARDAYRSLRDTFGTDRLLWGSDWPHTQFEASENPQTVLALLEAVVTDKQERHALLIDTPAELFHFLQ